MALYRSISPTFWTDSKVSDNFSPEDKYFYLYLLTNPHTNLCGCYEISLRHMAMELGYEKETVVKLINRMAEDYHVVKYCRETNEILLVHWYRYNWTKSPNFIKGIKESLEYIKCPAFKEYIIDILLSEKMIDENDELRRYTDGIPTVPDGIPTSVSVSVSNILYLDKENTIDTEDEVDIIESDLELCKDIQGISAQESQDAKEIERDVATHTPKRTRNTIPPTIEEVALYCQRRRNGVDAEEFWDFYQSKGWKIGKEPMHDWQSAVRNWERRNKKRKPQRIYFETETAWKAAKWLSDDLVIKHPTLAPASNDTLQVWAAVFEKMETEDQHSPGEILKLMKFASLDDFWGMNINTPWDLRKNYVKILSKAEKEGVIK